MLVVRPRLEQHGIVALAHGDVSGTLPMRLDVRWRGPRVAFSEGLIAQSCCGAIRQRRRLAVTDRRDCAVSALFEDV
eukprot:CAMPEP_0185708804 /NCGR_PEP_ID=MMETSP1164-20130828/27329_1 /TAXON_ID=1104430 /ORGANISM="Chrysoreinhardia sp, Strain CCMP2950" /LENGTH=76 /DNA_ID=CAMNT_0028376269 /DNA_START=30 /DNA_END=257 /DNA_ORIENTATION=-